MTDDTEMTIALLHAIHDGYTADRAVRRYVDWANSGTKSLGRNTRHLFHGYTRATPSNARHNARPTTASKGTAF